MTAPRCVIAIDAGTTGVRSRAIFPAASGASVAESAVTASPVAAYREFTQHYPRPGWVEHDATEIWQATADTLSDVVGHVGPDRVAAIGITNQRETVVAWNRATGQPYGTAIVWQDRRTAARCDELAADGQLERVRRITGLVLDPYFSATKLEWLLANRDIPVDDSLAVGTIDSWLMWNLTGGEVHATDPSNASRTMLFDIDTLEWSDELCELFGVPRQALPEVRASSGRFGVTSGRLGTPAGIAVAGVAGDQQAALFGQACIRPGMAKNTYGTGSFVLLNVGERRPEPVDGMLTSVGWVLADGTVAYVLEGSIFVTGATVQWLRDELQIIDHAADTEALALSVDDTAGVYLVPAFTGLGSPWWDPYARGTVLGISRGTNRAHLARAAVESMAFQTRDVVDAMVSASGIAIDDLRVDGGASAMDLLLQFQADQLGVTVRRPVDQETTALGAAYLAGLAEGVWPSLDAIAAEWTEDVVFAPSADRAGPDSHHTIWRRAVDRSRAWST